MKPNLKEYEKQFWAILNQMAMGVAQIELDGRWGFVNPTLCELLGYSPEELQNQTFHDLLPIADRYLELVRLSQPAAAIDDRTTPKMTQRFLHKTKGWIDLDFTLHRISDSVGAPKYFIAVLQPPQPKQRDTERLRSQRLDSLHTLAGGIADQLNDVLTPILATAQLLPIKFPDADDRTQQLLELLEANAKRATKLIQQLLIFSGKSEPQHILLNVERALIDMMQLLQATLPKSIETQMEINPFHLGAIKIAPTHWNLMVLNLCLNACDAMPKGGHLTVSANTEWVHTEDMQKPITVQAGSYLAISISDTGCGIPPEILDRIFEPFFTTKPHHSGIGLSLVTGIVKSHGGWVTVQSEVGKGSHFTLYLPWVNHTSNRPLQTLRYVSGGENDFISRRRHDRSSVNPNHFGKPSL